MPARRVDHANTGKVFPVSGCRNPRSGIPAITRGATSVYPKFVPAHNAMATLVYPKLRDFGTHDSLTDTWVLQLSEIGC